MWRMRDFEEKELSTPMMAVLRGGTGRLAS
jgi:hypothetical protein